MKVAYSRLAGSTDPERPNYWQYFGRRLVDLAGIPRGAKVLDIGTGPGSVLLPAAERAQEPGFAVGIDFDADWFRHLIARVGESGLKNTALAHMDAENLGLTSGLFDHVLCGFVGWGICFDFAEMRSTGRGARLLEMTRVLRAGGQVGISSWQSQDDLEWLGEHFRGSFPAYVEDQERKKGRALSVYSKENAQGLQYILQERDYQDVEITVETAEFVSTDEEEWWWQVSGVGWCDHMDKVALADAAKFERFKGQVFDALQQHKQSDGIHFSKTVLFAFGKKARRRAT